MHRATVSLLLLLACAATLPAQQTDADVIPGGSRMAAPAVRKCNQAKIEMIDVRPALADSTLVLSGKYLDHVAQTVFFYFDPPEAEAPRYALVRLTVHRDGTMSSFSVVQTTHDYFSQELQRALGEAERAGAFTPFPANVPNDSIRLELSAGRRIGNTKPYLAKRTTCPAWPLSSNPSPEYPVELRRHNIQGYVRAQFMVDPTGHPEPSTLRILTSTDDGFTQAVEAVLPKLRYQPAEVQGHKVAQLTEQVFTFGIAYRPTP